MKVLEEIKSKGIKKIHFIEHPENPAIIYILKSGRKVMVSAYGTVTIDLLETTKWYGWRIKRALKKAASHA